MAVSPSHKFGQIIGDLLEKAIEPFLFDFADRHGLYLDKHGQRSARRGKKVTWHDKYGNSHDLDYVIERDGTDGSIGTPVAFIESAWRRYTKHSRNKAQEIQAAILPLSETYERYAPFLGVVLGGVFTDGARKQLASRGFEVLFFDYDVVIEAFEIVGINAYFDELTPDSVFAAQVQKWSDLTEEEKDSVATALVDKNLFEVNRFMSNLETIVGRKIRSIVIVPFWGSERSFDHIPDAVDFICNYAEETQELELKKFEVQIRYTNGDSIDAKFVDRNQCVTFLREFISK